MRKKCNYIRTRVYNTAKQYKALKGDEARTLINGHTSANVRILLALSVITYIVQYNIM